jgi:hypothetical protein
MTRCIGCAGGSPSLISGSQSYSSSASQRRLLATKVLQEREKQWKRKAEQDEKPNQEEEKRMRSAREDEKEKAEKDEKEAGRRPTTPNNKKR